MMKKAVSKGLQSRSVRGRLAPGSARKSTIYDVASDAGVSIATVSRFLKGFEPIAEETKKRVRTAIRRLEYRPSALATSLASRFKQSIGFLIPRGSRAYADLFLSEILSGISNGAAKHGWSIHITMLAEDDSLASQLQRHADLVDGSLVLDEALDHAAVRALLDSGHRAVLLNAILNRIPSVGIDNVSGSMDAIRHLVSLGHTRIACLSGGGEIGRERMKGFRAGLQEAGLKPVAMLDCEFQREKAAAEAARILAAPRRPTAIAVGSDWMAVGVLAAAAERGLKVPTDLSVVGYDDAIIAEATSPMLTTVHQPLDEMGREAFDLFRDALQSDVASPPEARLLKPRLVERGSTAPPPQA